jgi:molybdopterin-guanine dinucleotide biosynthesis protein A
LISHAAIGPGLLNFSGVVLAGGRSTRMGVDKALLRVGEESLLERQLGCLRAAGAGEVLISGRRDTDYSGLGARVVYDAQPDSGPLAGVAAALAASSCPVVLVLAIDMPAMVPAMLRKIVSRCTEGLGCVPKYDQAPGRPRFEPLAAVYPRAASLLAEHQLAEARWSMHAFVQAAIGEGLVRALPLEEMEFGYFANWNEPSDWTPGTSSHCR